ncbi:MAG: hypothetical protein PF693_12495 [Spirochaetia bacterium]|jgi:hypothetical protein|nr:hypothetical protein [Spirochaetia bacterium]
MSEEIEHLKEKIEQFTNNIKDYKSKLYDEYNTRADFIDILFSAFGWDMYNKKGVIEQFREVVREDKVIIQGKKKAPDYAFRIGPQVVFYVEAKKPSVDIKNNPEPAYQLRRYAHTQGLSLSILTDFEEISIYDTRIKPDPKDSAAVARVFYCIYDELFIRHADNEFQDNFTFLLEIFGKSAILNGSFNRYAEENKNKKGTGGVDKGFLDLLNNWREKLAINIALKNDNIDEYNLNIAVQKIIDRLVFLRIAEDRLMEETNYLLNTTDKENIFGSLLCIFEEADGKYNSGFFTSEDWLKKLNIEDKSISEIIKEMYYPKCPYEFSVLPIEILGNAYEQFLGKTIKYTRKTKYGHKVEIEEKPEVRKAGGVYYTPDYIVDYIVENTVGRKIEKLNPEEISKIKILDPACGSGLRKYIIENKALSKIISFGNNLIFEQASTYTGLFFLTKLKQDAFSYYEMKNIAGSEMKQVLLKVEERDFSAIKYKNLSVDAWVLTDRITNNILDKLRKIETTAGDIFADIMVGIQSGIDSIHILKIKEEKENTYICYSSEKNGLIEIEKSITRALLMGDEVKRYGKSTTRNIEIYPYHLVNGKTLIYEEQVLKTDFPLCYEYLSEFKKKLKEKRVSQKTNPKYWYSCHRQRKIEKFETIKIITPEISLGCNMTLDEEKFYHNTKVYSLIPKNSYNEDIKYWLGVLNSNLMWFFLKTTGYVLRGGYFTFKTKYIEPFPIPVIDFSNTGAKEVHDRIVSLVTKRVDLQSQKDSATGNQDNKVLNNMINATEKQLNSIVYRLYDLSEFEIQEIEKSCV